MLSEYQLEIMNDHNFSLDEIKNIVNNQGDKVLQFKQLKWLKPYIECNTKLQKQEQKKVTKSKTK